MIICFLCREPITPQQQVEHHHPIYKSQGGVETSSTHKQCHRQFHSNKGDFKAWGSIGGKLTVLTKRWAFNLKHVNTDSAYQLDRQFYLTFYAK